MKQVLIADPDPASRQAFNLLLTQRLGITGIHEASDSETLIKTFERFPVDILLLDWKMYGAPAPETCRLLLKAYPRLKIILLSVNADHLSAAQAAGAGFIHKGSSPEEVLRVLEPWFISID
jgi:DNA-binding NarL/FixJ family response regulator